MASYVHAVPIGRQQREITVRGPAACRVLRYRRLMVRMAEVLVREEDGRAAEATVEMDRLVEEALAEASRIEVRPRPRPAHAARAVHLWTTPAKRRSTAPPGRVRLLLSGISSRGTRERRRGQSVGLTPLLAPRPACIERRDNKGGG